MPHASQLVLEEMEGLSLGDRRLERRAREIVAQIAADPRESFPRNFRDSAQLEALYRFLRNDRVGLDALLTPHTTATAARCQNRVVRVAHDTTSFKFEDEHEREGLGSIKGRGRGQGFFLHAAVAVGDDEERDVLGFLGAMTFVRPWTKDPTAEKTEAARWGELVETARQNAGADAQLIHVMDREADIYWLLAQLQQQRERFVIRHRERRLPSGSAQRTTRELLFEASVMVCRSAKLEARTDKRSGKARKTNPSRAERLAKLSFHAAIAELPRPPAAPANCPERLTVNLVLASEVDTPAGEEPVEWMLLTSEPIDTPEQILAVVDHYRARWRIEECFKSIKTGCCFEKRQLSSYQTLVVALGLTLPVAFTLMRLRDLGRRDTNEPASTVLTDLELEVLHAAVPKCPRQPTVRQAMLAIAHLGGFLARNGEPGWSTLGKGYETLLSYVAGYRLGKM